MIVMTLLAAWLVLIFAPDAPIGRMLHSLLVAWPAERLSRIRGGHILLFVLLVSIAAAAFWLKGDSIGMFGMGTPDIITFAMNIEVSSYLDVLAALIVSASALRLRALRGMISRAITGLGSSRPRARRTRRERAEQSANDDEDGSARVMLAA